VRGVAFGIKLRLADKKSGDAPRGIAKFREETSKKAARLSSAAGNPYVTHQPDPQEKIVRCTKIILALLDDLEQKKGDAPKGIAKFREETSKKAARLSSAAEEINKPLIIGMQARLCVAQFIFLQLPLVPAVRIFASQTAGQHVQDRRSDVEIPHFPVRARLPRRCREPTRNG